MGIPWMEEPVELHSSRSSTCTMTPEQCAYKTQHWVNWYQADHVYAYNTIYFFIATIGVCLMGFWALRLAPASVRSKAWWQKSVGAVRYLTYRHYELRWLRWYTPSLGVAALIIIGTVVFLSMTLGPKPYYWPNTATAHFGNSPPLATRAGWMALACLPFMLVLPTKANMIASLTGVSHERLIIFHNWIGWAMLVLALVHTFPFIVYNISMGTMKEEWNTDVFYWTGVVALVFQGYLQFMSLPWIRNRFYEFFKLTHYAAALVFVVFFFIHCGFELTSANYFIAAGVLYSLHFLYPQFRTYLRYGINHRATFSIVSDQAVKITIPSATAWQPGQHIFLRFLTLGVHAFTAHPFTICSVAGKGSSKGQNKMVFYVQPRGGLTGRLRAAAAKKPDHSVPALLDGPYGGIRGRPLHTYDHSLVIACGAGAPFALGLIMERLLYQAQQGPSSTERPRPKMRVVLSSRDPHIVEWYTDALVDFLHENELPLTLEGVDIVLHRTGGAARPSPDEKEGITQEGDSKVPIACIYSRCDIGETIEQATVDVGSSVAIVACGPAGVLKEANDAAAEAQKRILSSRTGASEVYLHTELFSW